MTAPPMPWMRRISRASPAAELLELQSLVGLLACSTTAAAPSPNNTATSRFVPVHERRDRLGADHHRVADHAGPDHRGRGRGRRKLVQAVLTFIAGAALGAERAAGPRPGWEHWSS